MTTLNKTIAAVTASIIAAASPAFADGHALDADSARINLALDTDGDGTVSDDEIIDGNMAFFDVNGSGAIDAAERGVAEQMLMGGGTIELAAMEESVTMTTMLMDFDANSARLDTALDRNGDGEVTDDEIIDGNMSVFDFNGSGAIDARERGIAEQVLMSGNTVALPTSGAASSMEDPLMGLNVNAARLDTLLDRNGDGEVTNDEIIDGNEELFDTNGDGTLDAAERGAAELALENA